MTEPAIVPVSATTRVQAISRLAFWTKTSGSAWYCALCHGRSAGLNGMSGSSRPPRMTHILPGMLRHLLDRAERVDAARGR